VKQLFAPWRMEFIRQAGEEAPGCFFCRYLEEPQRDGENFVLARGAHCFVLLNRYPYNPGHLMIAPKRHCGDFTALSAEELGEMMALAQRAVGALKALAQPHGFNLGFNLERAGGAGVVDHVHLHLLPRWIGDTNFMPAIADTKVLPESLEETYRGLLAGFQR
jgi:ATP adenylyltransferase